MKLIKIRLVNIRSYLDETISFDSGITLLSGDIGSGKSSILLAVEFALFGSSRSDLPAEALLRKGATTAIVELQFEVSGKNVVIKRTLKQEKAGIRQGAGYLIVNGLKKDLTAIEMKAEIVALLGYPSDLAGRGKNYVYKYTVYCPQEEMKHILQENKEARLDILRKLFGIEKYKIVRDNLQIYLKDMRKEKLVLQTRLEPLEGFENDRKAKEMESEKLRSELLVSEKSKELVSLQLQEISEKYNSLILLKEKKEKCLSELSVLSEREKGYVSRRVTLESSLREVDEELVSLLLDDSMTIEGVAIEISRLEKELREFRERKVRVEGKVQSVQGQLKLLKEQLGSVSFDVAGFERLSIRSNELVESLADIDLAVLEASIKELEDKEREIALAKAKVLASIDSIKEGISAVSALGSCPTCKQDVSSSHKEHISSLEHKKVLEMEGKLREFVVSEEKLFVLLKEKRLALDKFKLLFDEKSKVDMELKILRDRKTRSEQIRVSLKEQVVLNNSLMKEMAVVSEEEQVTVPRLEQRLSMLRQVSSKLETKRQLLKHRSGLLIEQKDLKDGLEKLHSDRSLLLVEIEKIVFDPSEIEKLRVDKEKVRALFEEKSVAVAQVKVKVEHGVLAVRELDSRISELLEVKSALVVLSDQLHWLSNYFMNLTYTIEKEIMLKIYHRFNELFVHWFETLVEGSEISARLDSSFTPVIEQNGHEISFAYLSGGERTAASLAYRLSLNKVINDVVHEIKTKDLLMLDEPTDGFSSEQLDRLRDVLEKLNLGQIVIVSHENTVEGFVNRVVRIEKSGGKSMVVG